MNETNFARIIEMKARPGRGGEFVTKFRDDIASTAVELTGMRRLYLFREVGKKDQFVALSLWNDKKAAENYAKSSQSKYDAKKLSSVQKGKEEVRQFYVELHVVGKSIKHVEG